MDFYSVQQIECYKGNTDVGKMDFGQIKKNWTERK